ncbi:MAG: hypothetical protein GXY32_04785 [Ruminococcaceae bacterium]|nr:hypothetical protein [Oscillospiraceae bacterium]
MPTTTAAPKKHKKRFIVLWVVVGLLAALIAAFLIYTGIYYHADADAQRLAAGYDVQIEQRDGYIALTPTGAAPTTGYVFYPGGKVAAEAYLPYLAEVAEQGYTCALLQPPFHLAIFDTGAAAGPIADNPGVTTWAVGGHSLGGVAAASYAGKAGPAVRGLVLLAAYPNTDLSQSGLQVASITATQDTVLNWDTYEASKTLLPPNTVYISIAGGNHGQFGLYGPQSGDGAASISAAEQRAQVAEATLQLLAGL